MSLAVAIQMDPVSGIDIDADSTFALALEAQRCGHRLSHYLVADLSFREGRLTARTSTLEVRRDAGAPATLGPPQTEDLSVSIVRRGSEWSFNNPAFGAIDQTEVSSLLDELDKLKYREIIQEKLDGPGAFGLDRPFYSLSLYDDDDRLIDRVISGTTQPGPRTRYATSLSSRHLGTVDAEPLEGIRGIFKDFQLE